MPNCCENRVTVDGPPRYLLALCAYIAPDWTTGLSDWEVAAGHGVGLPLSAHTTALLAEWKTSLAELALERDKDIVLTRLPYIEDPERATPLPEGVPEGPAAPATATRASATLGFDSAWSPPVGWLRTVARLFPQFRIRLHYVVFDHPCAGWRTCVGDACEGAQYEDEERIDAIARHVYAT